MLSEIMLQFMMHLVRGIYEINITVIFFVLIFLMLIEFISYVSTWVYPRQPNYNILWRTRKQGKIYTCA